MTWNITKEALSRGGKNAAGVRLVTITCADCGTRYSFRAKSPGRSTRCPDCANEARQYKQVRVLQKQIGGHMKIVKDIDGSWGYNSSLTMNELRDLLRWKWVAPGTEILNTRDDILYRVVTGQRWHKLERIAKESE